MSIKKKYIKILNDHVMHAAPFRINVYPVESNRKGTRYHKKHANIVVISPNLHPIRRNVQCTSLFLDESKLTGGHTVIAYIF